MEDDTRQVKTKGYAVLSEGMTESPEAGAEQCAQGLGGRETWASALQEWAGAADGRGVAGGTLCQPPPCSLDFLPITSLTPTSFLLITVFTDLFYFGCTGSWLPCMAFP